MAIYEGSRYTHTNLYRRDDKEVFEFRERVEFNLEDSLIYEFIEGDTIDGLAHVYYGDSHLRWVILEANKQYNFEQDIRPGDELILPSPNEVRKLYG